MDTIVAILRAAHCKSTHHFFAIDSLWEIRSPRGELSSDLLLAHYGEYLKGAKDPENVFKDFENHVMHVAVGYWGGAAKSARKWLDRVYQLLNSRKWNEAAYAMNSRCQPERIGLQMESVKEFLDSDPEVLAEKINTPRINSRLIVDWQDQAYLACQIDRWISSARACSTDINELQHSNLRASA